MKLRWILILKILDLKEASKEAAEVEAITANCYKRIHPR